MKLKQKIVSVLSAAACAVSFCAGTVTVGAADPTGSGIEIKVNEMFFNAYSAGEKSWRNDGITVLIDGEEAEVSADDLKFTLNGEEVTPASLFASSSDDDYNGEYTLEVSYMDSDPVEYKAGIGRYGDVNLDRRIDIRDYMMLIKHLINIDNFPFSRLQSELSNVEYDNAIDMADAAKLYKYVLGNTSIEVLGPENRVPGPIITTLNDSDYSADNAVIEIGRVNALPGEEVVVPVYLDTNGKNIDAISAMVNYDLSSFELSGICDPYDVDMRSGAPDGNIQSSNIGTFIINSYYEEGIAINPSEPIVCLIFRVRDNTREGKYDISIVNADNGMENQVEVATVQQPGEKATFFKTDVKAGSITVYREEITTPAVTTSVTTTTTNTLYRQGGAVMKHEEWLLCPICHNKTRIKMRKDTELKKFPLYCPKCKQESLIDAKNLQVTVIKGLEMKTQS